MRGTCRVGLGRAPREVIAGLSNAGLELKIFGEKSCTTLQKCGWNLGGGGGGGGDICFAFLLRIGSGLISH